MFRKSCAINCGKVKLLIKICRAEVKQDFDAYLRQEVTRR